MTLAQLLAEWARVLEDPDNIRFTTTLFYEGFNQAMEYLCLHAPRKVLKGIEVIENNLITAGTYNFDLPTPASSELIRITAITLGSETTQHPCVEVPLSQIGVVQRNPYYTSTNTHPRYVRKDSKIQLLHTVVTVGTRIFWYYIKKPLDVSVSQTTIEIPIALQRPALRMAVDYARWKDEEIAHEQLFTLWEAETKKLETIKDIDI